MTKQNGSIERRPRAPEGRAAQLVSTQISDERHQRICKICKHPEREFIEQEFLHWFTPRIIAQEYGLTERAIYRHAHATGLFELRRRNLRCVYENFLEEAKHVMPTANDILRAARAYTRVSEQGEWIEPPTTHYVVASAAPSPQLLAMGSTSQDTGVTEDPNSSLGGGNSNRQPLRVENAVTP